MRCTLCLDKLGVDPISWVLYIYFFPFGETFLLRYPTTISYWHETRPAIIESLVAFQIASCDIYICQWQIKVLVFQDLATTFLDMLIFSEWQICDFCLRMAHVTKLCENCGAHIRGEAAVWCETFKRSIIFDTFDIWQCLLKC